MKSQSTITDRLFSEHSVLGGVGSEISYLFRKHKDVIPAIGIALLIAGIMSAIFLGVNASNNAKNARYAKLYHYAVGSKESCNLAADRNVQATGWVPCTITAVSKDNLYYTATFNGGGGDGHHDTTTSYKFENPFVGKP